LKIVRAGATKVSITPAAGVIMDGYAERRSPSLGIHDPLFVRSLVIDNDDISLALLSCDLCFVNREIYDQVREEANKNGISEVILASTHNHSGPATTDLLVDLNQQTMDYLNDLPHLISNCVISSKKKIHESRVSIAKSNVNLSFNRRESGGSTDTEVSVVTFSTMSGTSIGTILNYACHPTILGSPNLLISSDFPGHVASLFEKSMGSEGVCLFLNGACGDVNPYTCTGYHCRGSFSDVENFSKRLFESAFPGFGKRELDTTSGLSSRKISIANIPPYGLALPIYGFRIGELVLMGLPGEIFASTGLELKSSFLGENVILVGYANGYYGYFPTREAFERKDYETKEMCYVDSEASKLIVKKGTELINQLLKA
jgi:neutral ceramidase